jgi:hypothetical protein
MSIAKGAAKRRMTPGRGTHGSSNLLSKAAEAVANALCAGTALMSNGQEAMAIQQLRDAFLAEHADASADAAARCTALRSGFAVAIRKALSAIPAAAALLVGDSPDVRVEVRSTAGRRLTGTSFAVGRCACSDVQVTCDATVSRLQFIAVSLPKGILIIDAWSGHGTRTISRDASNASSRPSSIPSRRAVYVLAHDERATLQIGMEATVTLGLSAIEANKAMALASQRKADLPGDVAPALPGSLVRAPTTLVVEAPSASVATTIPDAPPCPSVATTIPDAPCAAAKEEPAAADIGRQVSSATRSRVGSLSKQSSSNGRHVKLKRVFSAVRASAKSQRLPSQRSQLIWRCKAGARDGLLNDEQCSRLEERVNNSEYDLDEVSDILDGIGIPPAPQGFKISGSGAKLGVGVKVCILDLTATPELNGSIGVCKKWLDLRGRWAVKLENGEVKALRPCNVAPVPEQEPAPLPESLGSDFSALKCKGALCNEILAVGKNEPRRRFQCSCGAPAVCTGCNTSPYHFHGQCADMPKLRERWHDWSQGRGREAYRGLRQKAMREATAQRRALQEATEGDGSELATDARRRHLLAARAKFIKGEGVRHFFTCCTLCGSGGQCIVGPRFQCLHCPAFDCCLKCEPELAATHDKDHVFRICFECEFDWGQASVEFPVGTRARLRQHPVETLQERIEATPVVGRKRKQRGYGLEGIIKDFKRGKYTVELLDGGVRYVVPQDLHPLLTQHQAQLLLESGAAAPQ